MFTGENNTINEENLKCIPSIVNQDPNDRLTSNHNMEELK